MASTSSAGAGRDTHRARRLAGGWTARLAGTSRPTAESHTATPFELFFDLVYVFAVTQVTGYMAHEHSGAGVLQGMLLLALLWGTWSAYTWLGNQARADEGVLRMAMVVAMAAIFVVALTIPEAWHDAPGGLDGPVVLVCAYVLVRAVHLVAYLPVAVGDAALRHQLVVTWGPMLGGAALLVTGALLGGWPQTALFAAALVVDWGGTYLTSRHGSWRLRSVPHLTERHGLFLILAIGESVVAIGVGAAEQPIGGALLVAAVLGVAAAVCLWWLYFDLVSRAAERALHREQGRARVRLAIDAYTYGHFPIVAGVVVTALGVEGVLAHAGDAEPLGGFYAAALLGGAASYVGGHLLLERRLLGVLSRPRLVAGALLLLALPVGAAAPPLAALAGVVLLLGGLATFETFRYAEQRADLRGS